ncbi:MAG: hypothetical protein ACO3IB_14660, partial [Phycisphaerales bacterium]
QIQSNRHAGWLERHGVKGARRPNGDADARIEIFPETALEADDLADATLPPAIAAGSETVL